MIDSFIEYSLFIGLILYFMSGVLFFYLFLKTLKVRDGIGLAFLKSLTISISAGSFVIFIVRFFSEYGELEMLTARAIAVINPIILISVALYLNYLFCNSIDEYSQKDSQNIKIIKHDVKENSTNIKIIKHDMVKKKDKKC